MLVGGYFIVRSQTAAVIWFVSSVVGFLPEVKPRDIRLIIL
jgi:hypothetical protein